MCEVRVENGKKGGDMLRIAYKELPLMMTLRRCVLTSPAPARSDRRPRVQCPIPSDDPHVSVLGHSAAPWRGFSLGYYLYI